MPVGSCTALSTASSPMARCQVTRPLVEVMIPSTLSSVKLAQESMSQEQYSSTWNQLLSVRNVTFYVLFLLIVDGQRLTRVPCVEVWSSIPWPAKSYIALQTVRQRFNVYASSCVAKMGTCQLFKTKRHNLFFLPRKMTAIGI